MEGKMNILGGSGKRKLKENLTRPGVGLQNYLDALAHKLNSTQTVKSPPVVNVSNDRSKGPYYPYNP
jgi:hypothetical protein